MKRLLDWVRTPKILLRLGVVLTIAVVGAVSVDPNLLAQHYSSQMLYAILAVQPLVLAVFIPLGWRFRMLTGHDELKLRDTTTATIIAMGFNLVLPGRISEFLKISYLRKHGGLSPSTGFSALFLERVGDVVIFAAGSLISLNFLFFGANVIALASSLAVVVLAVLLLPYLEHHLAAFVARLPGLHLKAFLIKVITHAVQQIRDGRLYASLGAGMVAWVMSYLCVPLFLNVAGIHDLGMMGGLAIFIAATIGAAIPALPGGLGTFEAGAVLVLMHYGYGLEQSIAIAVALHISHAVGVFLVAFALGMRHGAGVSGLIEELRNLRRDAQASREG